MQQSNSVPLKTIPLYRIYYWAVTIIGLLILVTQLPHMLELVTDLSFLLLTLFVIIVQHTSASLPVSNEASVTYSVSSAISVASIPLYGIQGILLLELIGSIYLWLFKPRTVTPSKRLSQFAFNVSMLSIVGLVTALVYQFLTIQLPMQSSPVGGYLFPVVTWVISALVYDQTNQWLVLAIIKLQHGNDIDLLDMWRENRWASLVSISVITVGGGSLTIAVGLLDWLGIAVFFLPVLATSYAFTVYVSKTKQQMSDMETIITDRTSDLQRLNREKDAFLALLTHDMKSPLTSIGMYAEMMRRKPDLIRQKPHTIENILRAHATLNDLVNNIVDLEKLQTDGALPLEQSLFDVTDLTEYVVEVLQPQAEQKHITLTTQLSRQEIHLNADRLQIERVLTNLISNAVKYTKEHGTVDVRVWQADEQVCIAVQDTGYGIPTEELPYIFDRYRRVDKHRNMAVGTGLGLAIAKAIAEGHGGRLLVESAENVGSTFTLSLPLSSQTQFPL